MAKVGRTAVRLPEDPLAGELILRLVDPVSTPLESPDVPAAAHAKGLALCVALTIPVILGVAFFRTDSQAGFLGPAGLARDIGFFANTFFLFAGVQLMIAGRRFVPRLAAELAATNVVRKLLPGKRHIRPLVLRWLEVISRLHSRASAGWMAALVVWQSYVYWGVFMPDPSPRWFTDAARPGTFLFFLRHGARQPNVAGIITFVLFNPIVGYIVVVFARLLIVFACFCFDLARNRSLSIRPSDVDNTGGLGRVGRASLYHSLFTFAVGVQLAGLTVNELISNALFRAGSPSPNARLLFTLWGAYLFGGTILFFLPLWPLRKRMVGIRRHYVTRVRALYVDVSRTSHQAVLAGSIDEDSLRREQALGALLVTASAMAVWPFDKRTVARFGGVLLTPAGPLFLNQLPRIVTALKDFLQLGAL